MSASRPESAVAVESLSGNSREAVRQRFLAACEASKDGGPPPDLDSLLSAFLEPERSELRTELEAAKRAGALSRERAAEPGAATTELYPHHAGTVETAPAASAATGEFVPASAPAGTLDYIPPSEGTIDHVADPLGGTIDHVSSGSPDSVEASGFDAARAGAVPMPKMVGGYQVLRVLGRGAMGVVYKARQRGLKRVVALKMILAGSHASEHDLGRFRSEAEAVAELQHPNIVQLYEVGEENGRPFFSLEYVDGVSLDSKARGAPLPPAEAARLARQMAEAMAYAHSKKVIHRDLKPANVMLTSDGIPKITDFGLAKSLEDDSSHTRSGTILGTPSYMPPEQAEGKAQEVGPISDVYSLGAILYEMLTGRPPFRGATILDTLQQVRTQEPVAPTQFQPGVPADLETICLKCLQKEAAKRYSSAGTLAEDLRRFLNGEPIQARPVSRVERVWRWCRRNPRTAGLSATVAGLIVVWAATSSMLAWNLNVQKDLAEKNANEAIEQKGRAETNLKEAEKQTVIAGTREKRAKDTADATVKQMVELGGQLHNRLQGKRLSLDSGPEVRKAREDILNLLRQSLAKVSQKIEAAEASTFGAVASAQQLGDLFKRLGQTQEALRAYEQGYEINKKICADDPDNDLARANLGVMIQRLGETALELNGDAKTARKYYTEARDLHQAILDRPLSKDSTPEKSKRSLSHDYLHLGEALLSLGDPAGARKCFQQSLSYREEWLAAEPSSAEARSYVMQAHLFLGTVSWHLDDEKGVHKHFAEGLRIGEFLTREFPKFMDFKDDLAVLQGAHGDALLRLGKTEEAEKSYKQSLQNLELVIASNPDDLSKHPFLALTHERLGLASIKLGNSPEGEKRYKEALQLRKDLWEIDRSNLSRQAAFVLALARAGNHGEAAQRAAIVRQRFSEKTPLLCQLARCYAHCAAADAGKKQQHTDAALEALRAATRKEFRDAAILETDPDLESLRTSSAFRQMISDIKKR